MATTYHAPITTNEGIEDGDVPAVAVTDVHKSFGEHVVLNGVSLAVNPGKTLAVLGRSGTGKSVLLKLIVGLVQPDSGSVSVQGRGLAGLGIDQLGAIRKKMGFLFQHAALYDSLTVAENVAFPLEHHRPDMPNSERTDRVQQLLAEVGMQHSPGKMPADISGGMRKRAGLARALALEPEILLLDEPTAGLDPISSAEIDDLVLKLKSEHHVTSIVVTHDLHSAKTIADSLALIDEGCVAMEGTFDELKQSNNRFVEEFLSQS
jgi:phospholipid/cholesterol/gamma-HCH transport system ATP-binding protein